MLKRLVVLALLLPVAAIAVEWTNHLVDDYFEGGTHVYTADMDGDGDMDVLGAALYANDICWWENDAGNGLSWTKHVVDDDFNGACCVYAEDVDGDGDLDVLGAAVTADAISWWENLDGDGLSWTENNVTSDFTSCVCVFASDVDGDGDMDILGAAGSPTNSIYWWENNDGIGTTLTVHILNDSFPGANCVVTADVDGDGAMDVLGSASITNDVTWWRNDDGDGLTWTETILETDYDGANSVCGTDMDGDGDIDVLASGSSEYVTWWENVDGDGLTWTDHLVTADILGASYVHAEDMDNDGDPDVIAAADSPSDITWWKNVDGDGLTWTELTLNSGYDMIGDVFAADVDGDGDTDILGMDMIVDDVTIWMQHKPVEVTLTPLNYPIFIPSAGGPFWYSISLANYTPDFVQGVLLTRTILPGGGVYGPMIAINLALGPNQTLSSPILEIDVPAFAPQGEYLYRAIFDPFTPYPPQDTDEILFIKLAPPSPEEMVPHWNFTSWDVPESVFCVTDEIPTEYAVSAAYPNPFNASTTIEISLPEASQLSAKVYNVAGQQVAELATGEFNPGMHKLTLDATGMASGLYFLRVTAQGKMHHVQKVMLVR